MVYAKYDLTFPVDLSLKLIEEIRRRGYPLEVARAAVRPLLDRRRAVQVSSTAGISGSSWRPDFRRN